MKEVEKLSPKQAFLKQLDEAFADGFLPKEWDSKKKERVAAEITPKKIKTGMATSIPMTCRGAKCPFSENCQLFKEDIHPLGYPCPYEMGMVLVLMSEYAERLEINIEDIVDYAQIRDIVNLEIQEMRSAKFLAKESFIQENVVGISADGEPIFKKELHLAVELSEKAAKRKAQLLKQLLATREAKSKAKALDYQNIQTISNVMQSFRDFEAKEKINKMQELGIIEVDEYIEKMKESKDE